MSLKNINPRSATLLLFVLCIGLIRVALSMGSQLSPLCNFTPIGAMALFGGAYFSNSWKAYGFPLATLLISDLILSATAFREFSNGFLYEGWYWTYLAFALMSLTGRLLITKPRISNILVSALVCTLIHWMISDIGAWQMGTMYPKTFGGYITCLIAAIPYEWRFLAGTFVYSSLFFGLFEWMQNRFTALRPAMQTTR